jgi:hypothetical protein
MTIDVRIKPDGDFLPQRIKKDPADVVDVVIDYTQYFKTGTLTGVTTETQNIDVDSSSLTDNVLTLFISGGTNGVNGRIKLTASTSTVTIERTIIVQVEDK